MDINIKSKVLDKCKIDVQTALALVLLKKCGNIPLLLNNMYERGLVDMVDTDFGYSLTNEGIDAANFILCEGKVQQSPQSEEAIEVALAMMEIYPNGRKESSASVPQSWRGNKYDITNRIIKFWNAYGHHSKDEMVDATKRYVDSFNGDYTYMKLLKYFIWKCDGLGSSIANGDSTSLLADFLENKSLEPATIASPFAHIR